jgi:adenylate cyclase
VSELNRRELSRRGLLGPEEGWSLAPVGAWLMLEGRHIVDPVALLAALAGRLDAAGASVDRLGFTLGTIHPQILAWGGFWTRSKGAAEFSGWHGVEHSDAYIGSQVQFVREHKRPFRRRLDALDEERDHAILHELRADGMTDYTALPLVFGSGAVNFMTVATAAPGGFSDGDLERLAALSNLLAPLVEVLRAGISILVKSSSTIFPGPVRHRKADRINRRIGAGRARRPTAISGFVSRRSL